MIHDKITFKFSIQPLMVDKFKQRKEKKTKLIDSTQIVSPESIKILTFFQNPPNPTKFHNLAIKIKCKLGVMNQNESNLRNLKHPHK